MGDGPSDRYAAHHADVVFAKAALAAWCDASSGIPCEPWTRLADVADWIEQALADGRLPAGGRLPTVEAAADRSPTSTTGGRHRREAFICGPEVWGEGRTTVPDGAFAQHPPP